MQTRIMAPCAVAFDNNYLDYDGVFAPAKRLEFLPPMKKL